jgi:hypothetical protein
MEPRGIVVAAFVFVPPDGLTGNTCFGAALRRYAVYWDRIDWPENGLVRIRGNDADIALLESERILTRAQVTVRASGSLARLMVASQFAALKHLERSEPGRWALAQEGIALAVPDDHTTTHRAIQVELHNVLPTPAGNVPLDRILEFKRRRTPELLALRAAMDALYEKVVQSNDIPSAKTAAVAEIQRRVYDVTRTMGESFPTRLAKSVKVTLNPKELLGVAAATAFVLDKIAIPLTVSCAVTGLATAASTLRIDLSTVVDLPTTTRDFAYCYHVGDELGPK